MKAFIVIAFALCYFLQDGVEGRIQFDWRDDLTNCFKGLGFAKGGKKDLEQLRFAVEYTKLAYTLFVKYNSAELDNVLEIIGWKNDALTADQKKNLKKVLGRRIKKWLRPLQKVINDVKKQFKNAANGDEALYKKIWTCVASRQLVNPANEKAYLVLKAGSASCAENVIGKPETKEFDLAIYRYQSDIIYMYEAFGNQALHRALQRLNIFNDGDYLQLILRPLDKKRLFTPEEKHLGNYYLPGQFSFVYGAHQRFSDSLKKVSTPVNNRGKKGNKGKPDGVKAKQLINCILNPGKKQG